MDKARIQKDTDIFNLGGDVYAFDSTIVELCLSVFCWAKSHKRKIGRKSILCTMWRLRPRRSFT